MIQARSTWHKLKLLTLAGLWWLAIYGAALAQAKTEEDYTTGAGAKQPYVISYTVVLLCFALGLLAVPLGLQPMAGRRSLGLVLGLFFFIIYYLLLIVGWAFGESGTYPPAIGMWLPNVIMAGIGLFLLVRTARERPLRIDSMILWMKAFKTRFIDRGP